MRTPSIFTDVTVSDSFFLIAPEIAPRTEWACQPVAFDSPSMVAPWGYAAFNYNAASVTRLPVSTGSQFPLQFLRSDRCPEIPLL